MATGSVPNMLMGTKRWGGSGFTGVVELGVISIEVEMNVVFTENISKVEGGK